MKLKDIEDNNLFTWWTLVDKKGNKITSYENKENNYSNYVGSKENNISKTFSCIRDAEKATGINNSSISRCCKGKQAKAGGYKWEYVEMSETSWKDKKGYELC